MESLRPSSFGSLLVLLALAGTAATARAEPSLPEIRTDLPITIDADSSEFDYVSSRLVFKGLRMDQGGLGIEADVAETDKLDFTDGVWIFNGNVVVKADNTTLYCDQARVHFVEHELTSLDVTGAPARFEQLLPETNERNTGQANSIAYSAANGIVTLRDNARFSDGGNEVTGELITYDIISRHLTAGSGDSGPVKIVIEPPEQLKEKARQR